MLQYFCAISKVYVRKGTWGASNMHISVTGNIIYFMCLPIAWKSHGQKGVVISITEAEYVALSDIVTALKFIVMVLQSMYQLLYMWIIMEL